MPPILPLVAVARDRHFSPSGMRKVVQLHNTKPLMSASRSPSPKKKEKSHDGLPRCILAPHGAFVALLMVRFSSFFRGSESGSGLIQMKWVSLSCLEHSGAPSWCVAKLRSVRFSESSLTVSVSSCQLPGYDFPFTGIGTPQPLQAGSSCTSGEPYPRDSVSAKPSRKSVLNFRDFLPTH